MIVTTRTVITAAVTLVAGLGLLGSPLPASATDRIMAVAPPQPAFQSPVAPSLGNGAPVMPVSPNAVPTVTKANFSRLERAMTYSEVVAILGVEGQWRPADTVGAVTDTYVWRGTGGAPDATLTATFERGFLVEKTQHGLA